MRELDPADFCAPSETGLDTIRSRPSKNPPHHRPGESFLKGPIPWAWIEKAGKLPGKALAIAMVLWKQVGCDNRRTVRFNLTQSCKRWRVSIDTGRRGLKALVTAGLISVVHPDGKCLMVTVNDTKKAET